jgi:hypothetical protein
MRRRSLAAWWLKRVVPTAVFLAVVALAGLVFTGGTVAQPPCKAVHGHVYFQVQPSGALTVTFTGGIRGESVLTHQEIFSAGDPDVPSLQIFIEKFALTLKDGTKLTYTDTGVFDANTFKTSSLDTFIEKDGVLGFFGQLQENTVVATTFDSGIGTYRGEICLGD